MSRHRIWTLVLALAASLAVAVHADEAWRALGPGGGSVASLAVDPRDARVLLAGSFGGLFRSTNSGHSWRAFGTGLAAPQVDLAFDPFSSLVCFAATPSGLWRSGDGGLTWAASTPGVPAGLSAFVVRTAPRQRGLVLALGMVGPLPVPIPNLTSFYVLRSTDGGRTWRVQNAGLPASLELTDLRPDPFDATVVYLGTGRGLYRSRDGGRSWRPVSLPGQTVWRVAPDPFLPARLWVTASLDPTGQRQQVLLSTDGGFRWQDRTPGHHLAPFFSLAGDPARRDHLYLGTSSSLLFSGDAGKSWRPIFQGFVASLVGDRATGTLAAGGGGYGVARSQDGLVWVAFQQGLRARGVEAVAAGGGASLWTSSGSLFVSQDEGRTWAATSAVVGTALVADPTSPAIAYAGSTQGLIRTRDGGSTWEFAGPPGTENGADPVVALAADPGASSGLYLLGTTGIWHSGDGGDTWHVLTPFAAPHSPSGLLAAAPGTPPVLFTDAPYQIYGHPGDIVSRSTDNGATWAPLSLTVPGRATAVVVDPADGERLWISHSRSDYVTGVSGGVSRSFDGGATWATAAVDAAFSPVFALLLDPIDADVVYAAAASGVFVSRDAGATWGPLGSGVHAASASGLTLRPGTLDVLYAATSGGVYALSLR